MRMQRALAIVFAVLFAFLSAGCGGGEAALKKIVVKVGDEKLRTEALAICREGFATGGVQKVPEDRWPASVRTFKPLSVWAEPDGAYLLLDSDANGERGIYLPRILSDKDPICGPKLTHVKLGEGVYTYNRKR